MGDTTPDPLAVPTWDPQAIVNVVGQNLPMQRRLLVKFVQLSEKNLAQMQQALAAGDLAGLCRGAHSLKSSARTVGAMALGQHCAWLEAAAREGDAAVCQAEMDGLPHHLGLACRHIQAWLDTGNGAAKPLANPPPN